MPRKTKHLQSARMTKFLDLLDKEREHLRHLCQEEIGNGVLDFYQYKGVVVIVQQFAMEGSAIGGIEVYVSAPGGGLETAARFVQKVEELREELQQKMDRESIAEVRRMLDKAIFGKN